MRKHELYLICLVLITSLISFNPPSITAQAMLSRVSWQENVFFPKQEFEWQYLDVSFNGAIQVICPCQNDSTIFILENDLSLLNLVLDDVNNISRYITHTILSQGQLFYVDNSTLLLNLEGIPFIYPIIREYSNGSRINWLEHIATTSPRTNLTDILYVTRRIESGLYIQRKVHSTNPWFRFETRIDLKTGILVSLWFEEGFRGISGPAFSHIYNLTLITDLPGTNINSNTEKDADGINIRSSIIGVVLIISILLYKFRKKLY